MVELVRLGQPKQFLQQALDAGRRIEVAAAHDMADALQGVVSDYSQVIAGRNVAARERLPRPALHQQLL